MSKGVLPETIFHIFTSEDMRQLFTKCPNVYARVLKKQKIFPPVSCHLFLQKNGDSSGFRRGSRR